MLCKDLGPAVVVEGPSSDEGEDPVDEVLVVGLVLAARELVIGADELELAPVDAALAVDEVEVGLRAVRAALEQPRHGSAEVGHVADSDRVAGDADVGRPAVASRRSRSSNHRRPCPRPARCAGRASLAGRAAARRQRPSAVGRGASGLPAGGNAWP